MLHFLLDHPLIQAQLRGKLNCKNTHQVIPLELEHSKTSIKPSPKANSIRRKVEVQVLQAALRQPAKSILSFKPTLGVNSIRNKTEPREPQVALQRLAQPKIISQQVTQSSISASVSCCNSLQGSHVPISRHHNAPSALGITTLLHNHVSPYPPPTPPPISRISPSLIVKNSLPAPLPPPPPRISSAAIYSISSLPQLQTSGPPTPPPIGSRSILNPTSKSSVSLLPPPPGLASKGPLSSNSVGVPHVPLPPTPCAEGVSKVCSITPQSHSISNGNIPSILEQLSGAPLNLKGWDISFIGPKNQARPRKSNLKPYHRLKLTRAMQGSIWAEAQKPEEASKAPEFDMLELESLFSEAAPNSDNSVRDAKSNRCASGRKSEKVQLSSVLALDDTALDVDQLLLFVLYTLLPDGASVQSFEKSPITQTVLVIYDSPPTGSAVAVGFWLDSLLKLTDTRARNNKMTLMHYLCKVLVGKLPQLLDFPKDLALEASTKLAEEMPAISKGLEKVVQELTAPVSETFCKLWPLHKLNVRNLLGAAEVGGIGQKCLSCVYHVLNFVRMFVRAHTENCKQLALEKKKAQKDAENEKLKISSPIKESEHLYKVPSRLLIFITECL
ncbi:hypothetical protein DITRI_Ditri10aG0136500 [Diplodiscus trichospermus]